ncbi:MAG TPA: cytochrome c biogenesis protein CcdA [Paracoccaceae bacterium]|nr:cytochrome c biogenesis protein CcdA [Paracoccaceae bacterium]
MLGIDLWDATLLPALAVATLAGVLSFLSPCVLPIVPPYLAYMAGASLDEVGERRGADARVARTALFFVLGLSTVFLFLGLAASAFGSLLLAYQREMAVVAGIVIIAFGLHFLGILRLPILQREARLEARAETGTALGAYVLGLAFAFGWTPCIGPVLGSILALAAQDGSVGRGMMLMGFYAIGLGVPFLLAGVFLRRAMGVMARMRRHMPVIERAMGVLLVGVGVMLLTGWFTQFSFWLLETFPALALIG